MSIHQLRKRLITLERLAGGVSVSAPWQPPCIDYGGPGDLVAEQRIAAADRAAVAAGCGPNDIRVVVVHRPMEGGA